MNFNYQCKSKRSSDFQLKITYLDKIGFDFQKFSQIIEVIVVQYNMIMDSLQGLEKKE